MVLGWHRALIADNSGIADAVHLCDTGLRGGTRPYAGAGAGTVRSPGEELAGNAETMGNTAPWLCPTRHLLYDHAGLYESADTDGLRYDACAGLE